MCLCKLILLNIYICNFSPIFYELFYMEHQAPIKYIYIYIYIFIPEAWLYYIYLVPVFVHLGFVGIYLFSTNDRF